LIKYFNSKRRPSVKQGQLAGGVTIGRLFLLLMGKAGKEKTGGNRTGQDKEGKSVVWVLTN